MKSGKGGVWTRILVAFCIFIVVGTIANVLNIPKPMSSLSYGYSSGFQGPKAKFYGAEWTVQGAAVRYPLSLSGMPTPPWGAPSLTQFNTVLKFDADGESTGVPNLIGEETSVFIPRESLGSIPAWLPTSWLNTMNYIQNPQANYSWTVGDNTYYMEQWLLRYYISISAEWDGSIDLLGGHGEIPPAQVGITDNSYSNLRLWIEFDTEPTWYIQGGGTAYFAIGKVQLADTVQYTASDVNGNSVGGARTTVSVSPESQAALIYLYYNPWGQGSVQNHNANYYLGNQLNPSLFVNKTYMDINLNKFGIYSGTTAGGVGFWVKGDTLKMSFDVTVFVIGKWNVQDIQDNPDNFGRFTRIYAASDIFSWLFSASTLAWLIPVIIIVLLIIFAPWFLLAVISLFRRK